MNGIQPLSRRAISQSEAYPHLTLNLLRRVQAPLHGALTSRSRWLDTARLDPAQSQLLAHPSTSVLGQRPRTSGYSCSKER